MKEEKRKEIDGQLVPLYGMWRKYHGGRKKDSCGPDGTGASGRDTKKGNEVTFFGRVVWEKGKKAALGGGGTGTGTLVCLKKGKRGGGEKRGERFT